MTKRYIRKPTTVEVIQYTGENWQQIKEAIPDIDKWIKFWKGRNLKSEPNKFDFIVLCFVLLIFIPFDGILLVYSLQ